MAFAFGESWDLYAATTDMVQGYWDSGNLGAGFSLVAGRFSGGQALRLNNAAALNLVKSSGSNDATHHIVCAFQQTAALSGTTLTLYFSLGDGATPQCTIVFRSDGAILLTSGGPTGTALATWTGGVNAQNTWIAYEFEVVINNTTGSFTARRNGNTSNDFTLGSLNTRGGTANNYASRLTVSSQGSIITQLLDDLLWRSDSAAVPWIGDVRCYTRMPVSDAAVQFAHSPATMSLAPFTTPSNTPSKSSGNGLMMPFTATYSGAIASAVIPLFSGVTGHIKAAIYDAARTTVLGTSSELLNPVAGANTVTFAPSVSVVRGALYHIAVNQDVSTIYQAQSSVTSGYTFTTAYASFPAASPTTTVGVQPPSCTLIITVSVNAEMVAEPQQDGATTYVYDSVVGHADFYGISPLAVTPASVVAVTTRAFVQKSDAGSRSGAVQLKSGATTVASPTTALSTAFAWLYRVDTVDPATGSAWTPVAVSNATIGPLLVS